MLERMIEYKGYFRRRDIMRPYPYVSLKKPSYWPFRDSFELMW